MAYDTIDERNALLKTFKQQLEDALPLDKGVVVMATAMEVVQLLIDCYDQLASANKRSLMLGKLADAAMQDKRHSEQLLAELGKRTGAKEFLEKDAARKRAQAERAAARAAEAEQRAAAAAEDPAGPTT